MNAPVVTACTPTQRRMLASGLARTAHVATSTRPIDATAAASALSRLYAEFGARTAPRFLSFASPGAAFQGFDYWWPSASPMLAVLWPHQLPLLDPQAYWRSTHRDGPVDLAIRRTPNAHGCYAYGVPLADAEGGLLDATLAREIWDASASLEELGWCHDVVSALYDRFGERFRAIDARYSQEDPTCQAPVEDFLFLGPFPWLLREVACARFASAVLGCKRNPALFESLEQILVSGSLVLTCSSLCILIERPVRFHDDGRVEYRDGYVAATAPLSPR